MFALHWFINTLNPDSFGLKCAVIVGLKFNFTLFSSTTMQHFNAISESLQKESAFPGNVCSQFDWFSALKKKLSNLFLPGTSWHVLCYVITHFRTCRLTQIMLPLFWHLLKKCSFCLSKVTSKSNLQIKVFKYCFSPRTLSGARLLKNIFLFSLKFRRKKLWQKQNVSIFSSSIQLL